MTPPRVDASLERSSSHDSKAAPDLVKKNQLPGLTHAPRFSKADFWGKSTPGRLVNTVFPAPGLFCFQYRQPKSRTSHLTCRKGASYLKTTETQQQSSWKSTAQTAAVPRAAPWGTLSSDSDCTRKLVLGPRSSPVHLGSTVLSTGVTGTWVGSSALPLAPGLSRVTAPVCGSVAPWGYAVRTDHPRALQGCSHERWSRASGERCPTELACVCICSSLLERQEFRAVSGSQ